MHTIQLQEQVPQFRFIFIIYMSIFIRPSVPTEKKSCSPSAKTLYVLHRIKVLDKPSECQESVFVSKKAHVCAFLQMR